MTTNIDLPELRPVTALYGVGNALAEKLAQLNIFTVQDVLFHLPFRYEDRTQTIPIGSLQSGERAVIEGDIELSEVAFRGRRQLLCRVSDGTGWLTLRFFHFSAAQQSQLARGTRLRCFGEVRNSKLGLEMVHPEYRRITNTAATQEASETLTPVYSATEGVQQTRLRQLTSAALQTLKNKSVHMLSDWLPRELLPDPSWPSLQDALEYVHHPPPDASMELLSAGMHPAQRRLAFEELLAQQLSLRVLRQDIQRDDSWSLNNGKDLLDQFYKSLPFQLTNAQQRVWKEIERDLAQPHPMLRLVQGDVGSGKTIVAALAAVKAVACGMQAALMAPTELLAEQHARNFVKWFEPLNIEITLLTGKHTGTTRDRIMQGLQSGSTQVAIGTHALFQSDVQFSKLALVIIDEQHRFGVHQRLLLREKGLHSNHYPHQLIMTATPIPRTLAMTAYADLDVSIIDELPPGRTPVQTVVLGDNRRDQVVQRVHEACKQQRQVYWVCPLIEESEVLEAQAAEDTHAKLSAALPDLRILLLHGRMNAKQKEAVMMQFKQHQADVLVATTVIEVGVDVPNATVMVIENAERMGLAQLHQLRGRVGRGSTASSCVLLFQYPLSDIAKQRLHIMRETSDGFEIARRDLELRGPGELLGTKQTGLAQLRVADLMRDTDLLPAVQQASEQLLMSSPNVVASLLKRWIGRGERFGRV